MIPAARRLAQNWLALDNITLLLYLGAALIVIAVGVFVGSGWADIPGLMRWGLVAGLALAFLGVGEGFIRYRAVLQRAGETFRTLGLVLLPFVVLAYQRFLLEGHFSPLLWLVSAALLAPLYYALYRWTSAQRLPAYLASMSLGVMALMLPESLNLDTLWRAPALLGLSGALLLVARSVEKDLRLLVRRFGRSGGQVLAESHLALGLLYALASLSLLSLATGPSSALAAYFFLLTLWLVGVAGWARHLLPLAAGAVSAGVVVIVSALLLPEGSQTWGFVLGLNGLGALLFVLGSPGERYLPGTRTLFTLAAVGWSTMALLLSVAGQPIVVLIAGLSTTLLWVGATRRLHHGALLWPALIALHVALFGALALAPGSSPVIPALLWVMLAGLWLAASGRAPAWLRGFFVAAFVAEAAWASLWGLNSPGAATLTGVGLLLGWILWTRQERMEWGVAASALQALYAVQAVVALLHLPLELVPLATLMVGALLLFGTDLLPVYTRRVAYGSGLTLLLVAPLSIFIGQLFILLLNSTGEPSLTGPRWLTLTATVQATLVGTTLAWTLEAWRRRTEWLIATATGLVYLLLGWLTVDYLPAGAAPLVAMALAVGCLALAPRLPNQSRRWMEPLGWLTALAAPLAPPIAFTLGASPQPLLGLGLTAAMQLGLALSTSLYIVEAWRHRTEWLIATATGLVYLLLAWLTVDYLPAGAAPLVAMALAVGCLALAPRLPNQSRRWMEPLGWLTALAAPLAPPIAFTLGASPQPLLGLGLTAAMQLGLALSTSLYIVEAWRRRTEWLIATATGLVYLLLGWLTVDYLPAGAAPLVAIALAVGCLALAPRLPARVRAWMEPLGWLTALAAPLAPPIAFTLGASPQPLLGLGLVAAMQLGLALSTILYIVETWRRRDEWLFWASTLLSYGTVTWLALDYLPLLLLPLAWLGIALLHLALLPYVPATSRRWMEALALLWAAVAPFSGRLAQEAGGTPGTFLGLAAPQGGQFALFLNVLLFGVRGSRQQRPLFVALAGGQLYLLYAWLALNQDVQALQAFSAPLALLLLGYGWLFPRQRQSWEAASMLALLLPAIAQSVGSLALLYTLILGAWGLILLALGITLGRRLLLLGGVGALLVAALRQVWSLVSVLPPGITIGLVGLTLMAAAIVLTLRRDALLRLRDRTGAMWEQLSQEE